MTEAVTPETAAVDAPVSMDSIIEEIATGNPGESDELSSVVDELEGGQAEEAAEPEEDATEATETDEETAEAEPEEQEDTAEPTFKVKVNGEEVEVPLSELQKGYSREADYTKKTMALAEERTKLQSQFASELKQQIELFRKPRPHPERSQEHRLAGARRIRSRHLRPAPGSRQTTTGGY
jgi:mRNA-degrading endonuclease YafQ of YafQ-DinJ toxin-antitoxin module